MANLTLRNTVLRPLTYDELDKNFEYLDSAIQNLPIGDTVDTIVDSAYVNALVDHPQNLSEFNNDAGFVVSGASVDATQLDGQAPSYYLDYNNFANTPTIPTDNTELTNGRGFLDTVGVQAVVDATVSGFDSEAVENMIDTTYLSQRLDVADLKDVNLTSLQANEILKWNGSQWINSADLDTFEIGRPLSFQGVVSVTDTAPVAPANGDMIINNVDGTVDASWTGISGSLAEKGMIAVWSTTNNRWYLAGGSAFGSGGVLGVTGSNGIAISSVGQQLTASVDRSSVDGWYAPLAGSVNETDDQTITGQKTFSQEIQGNISGNAASASTSLVATTATTAEKTQAALTINGISFDGQTARSMTLPTTDTVTRVRSHGPEGSYKSGDITFSTSGNATITQNGNNFNFSTVAEEPHTASNGVQIDGKAISLSGSYNGTTYTVEGSSGDVPALHVKSPTRGGEIKMTNTSGVSPTASAFMRVSTNGTWQVVNGSYKSVILQVSQDGLLTAANDLVAFSDEKLKDNIETAPLGIVEQLRGVEFDWKDTGRASSGMIAQEVREVLPHLVHEGESDDTLSVNYLGLIPYLIEEIKELKKQIAELK